MLDSLEFKVSEDDIEKFKRLDAYLASVVTDQSRTNIKKLFEKNHFSSDTKLELKKMPPTGTIIHYILPEVQSVDIIAQDIPLEILFEDDHLLIINKQAGLVVHPAPGNPDKTLVNAVLFHCKDLKGIGNERRPGIVHRLDKGTTGIMVVAKSQACHEGLVKLFSTHDITRKYEAIVLGTKIPSESTIDSPIGRSSHNRLKMAINVNPSKRAITHMKVLQFYKKLSHVELTLETGRTHQIRVHLSQELRCPILNDKTYGREKEEKLLLDSSNKSLLKNYNYPLLHAKTLGFVHPITQEKLIFEQEAPQIFRDILDNLNNQN